MECFDCRGTGVQRDLDGHRWDCTDCDGTGQTLVCTECGRHGAPCEFEGGCGCEIAAAVIRAREKWNAEADAFNQWDSLGQDEKDELIANAGIERPMKPQEGRSQ